VGRWLFALRIHNFTLHAAKQNHPAGNITPPAISPQKGGRVIAHDNLARSGNSKKKGE
jgi:hypothetical protein